MSRAPIDVSVALCTRNGERFIAEQIKSILDQSVPPREIVLSDDASSDATVEVARRTVDGHPGDVELVVHTNRVALGVTKNFEQAILACRFELIALSDQDDVWSPLKLEFMGRHFVRRPALALLCSDARLIDESGNLLGETLFEAHEITGEMIDAVHSGGAFGILARRNIVTGATVVVRREFARRMTPFPAAWVHDEWLAVTAASVGEMDILDEQLVNYRQHTTNEIGARRLSVLGKFKRMVEPGAERNRRLLERAESLALRLPTTSDSVSPELTAAVVDKLEHERRRSALPVRRVARIFPVIRELRTGRYRRFGRGNSDAARDLLQPLSAPR